jgi:hypothetical protein
MVPLFGPGLWSSSADRPHGTSGGGHDADYVDCGLGNPNDMRSAGGGRCIRYFTVWSYYLSGTLFLR